MEINFLPEAVEDLNYWKKSGNKQIQKRITSILLAITEDPFHGIGKPEPLKFNLSGKWSRRINDEHRVIYDVSDNTINIYSLKGHY
jgi:toxin YoeB